MSLWRQLSRGIADLWDRAPRDRDVADEVAHFREALEAEGRAQGMSAAEARRYAQLELGGATQVRAELRSVGWERAVATFFADLRYGWRGLWTNRVFSLVAVCTIAIGIGAATAIVSALRPVLFDSLPYPAPERVRAVVEWSATGERNPGTFGMYHELARRSRSFEAMAVHTPWSPTLTGDGRPERLSGQRVSASYLRTLGVAPTRGRDFREEDDRPGSVPVVIISHRLWQQHFGEDSEILRRTLRLDDEDVAIVGVMPADFENVLLPGADVWSPLQFGLESGPAWGHFLGTIGRLRPGVDASTAESELNQLSAQVIAELRPSTYGTQLRVSASSLQDDLTRDVRPALWAVLAAVGVVLLLAAVNVTNLLLARGARRREEFALRAALGASRTRLLRQVLTESLLLSLIGGAVGVAMAGAAVGAIVAASPAGLSRVDVIAVDTPILLFAIVLTTVTSLVVGLLPALQASGQGSLHLNLGTARVAGGRRRIRSVLVGAQVALALVLLSGSGLLLRSMRQLLAVSPGFDAQGILTMQVQASPRRYTEPGAVDRYFDDVRAAILRVPGVTEVALTSQLPLSGDHEAYGVTLASPPDVAPAERREIFRYAVSPGYLELLRIPLKAGRTLTAADRDGAPRSVVVNEAFVRRYFRDRDPIGERLWIGATTGEPYTVVGIVGDVKQLSLAGDTPDAVYTTPGQWRFAHHTQSLVVRGSTDIATLAPAVREAVWSVERDHPVARLTTMDAMISETAADRRFTLLLFEIFALSALALTAAGVYGMMAGIVAERTREFGLRAAVGATPGRIVALVFSFGARVTSVGLVIGVVAVVLGLRGLRTMLYGVSHLDVITHAVVLLLIALVAGVACALPAVRAARIDPAVALRD
ncbi:MAG: ABC transporter permease [Gemmatimonadaceae bacterium]|nr:ABC transporter permease [Gemmatimonadaceae bacterium]MCW5827316.1 ABC transporter permease [Gemmatimonadaceae bacterium]